MNTYGVAKRPRWHHIFPPRVLPPTDSWEKPEPGYAPGEFSTTVIVALDWRDRLRILVSGLLRVEVRTATDRMVGLAKSRSVAYVMPPGSRPSERTHGD